LREVVLAGLSVQPFKIGPDFIDTAYHEEAAGRPSVNLDLWMMGADNVKTTFGKFAAGADVAFVESMGALYDGEDGTERGSAAFVSKLLNIPIILVIDIWGMTRSAIPLLQGFLSFDRDLKFAGFVMNRAGSVRHAQMVLDALPPELKELCLGHVLHRAALDIPERHLGLITPDENAVEASTRRVAFEAARSGLNLARLFPVRSNGIGPRQLDAVAKAGRVRIAVARDGAFRFYYSENLSMLEAAGAELCFFSPTSDLSLPSGTAGIYIGGGYPESFQSQLASNLALTEQLRASARSKLPIYAECGGFMYLGRTLTGADRSAASMVGIFPLDTLMDPEHLAIRYVSVRTLADSPLGPAGTEARGQEFHQSRIVGEPSGQPIYDVTASNGEHFQEGMLSGTAMGSYIHLHFASNPEIPRNFVESCRSWARERRQ